ncbi:murein hydrolase activator EnvC family protein [Alicyclobacillus pomorum]|uniref:murein hydrolase activator EnvC family protein n=1 Tax=Alicyclobacillus pomorum TaxID=204470 RepID=UPI000413D490|nr:hypothetical protein [Alicyclobacillus pomorum]
MKVTTKILVVMSTITTVVGMTTQLSMASTLSEKQQLMRQLQAQSQQTAEDVLKNKQQAEKLQGKIQDYQSLLDSIHHEIANNQQQLQDLQKRLDQLNQEILQNQKQLKHDQQSVNSMLQALYEDGNVPYIEVLLQATNFSDFLSRLQMLSMITEADKELLQKVVALHHKLETEKQAQKHAYQSLQNKTKDLKALQKVDQSLQAQQKNALARVQQQIQAGTKKQGFLKYKIQLTQSQIAQLEQQVQQEDAILSTNVSAVTETSLQYQPIAPTALYAYVRSRNSTFSLQDIETICAAAQRYNVNPALLIAITGQEQHFVPPGPDADMIRNNPFNVFYSWQVYNTNLADTANIAADTLRHKLSAPPPAGEDPILWINDPRNPWGIYATDPNWAYGVRAIFKDIMKSI